MTLTRVADACQVELEKSSGRAELLAVLRQWSQFDTGEFLDRRDELTVRFTIEPEVIQVAWIPYVPLEKILGTGGRLLVGFDVARVLGKPTSSLRDAVSKSFTVDWDCNDKLCSADGPRPPGGALRVSYFQHGLMVTISTTLELVPRVRELIAASLGPGQQQGPDTQHVHVKDGVRYRVNVEINPRILTIHIDKP